MTAFGLMLGRNTLWGSAAMNTRAYGLICYLYFIVYFQWSVFAYGHLIKGNESTTTHLLVEL